MTNTPKRKKTDSFEVALAAETKFDRKIKKIQEEGKGGSAIFAWDVRKQEGFCYYHQIKITLKRASIKTDVEIPRDLKTFIIAFDSRLLTVIKTKYQGVFADGYLLIPVGGCRLTLSTAEITLRVEQEKKQP